jgi:phosphoribosylformylglycinamidine synthase subunit PurS
MTEPAYNRSIEMKARVYVSFKSTVLDPQGQTIRGALNGLGHRSIEDVRQGKFFDLQIAPGAARHDVERELDQIARDVLANPVIEEYSVEFLD